VRLHERAAAYGRSSAAVDGMDVGAVAEVIAGAAEQARAGAGPTLIEAYTYRFCGHMPGDTEPYRSAEEVERWRLRDPLQIARAQLRTEGCDELQIAELEADVEQELDVALAEAEASPEPDVEELALGAADWMQVVR
jgi:TPP-dependent pyruvate/acetoin dehydrogenase alpha subunit